MLGPFATASRRTPPVLHCHSPGVATVARRLRIDVHNNDSDNNDNAWQRGPLWPHKMGPISLLIGDRLILIGRPVDLVITVLFRPRLKYWWWWWWWQRHRCVKNLPKVVNWQWNGRESNSCVSPEFNTWTIAWLHHQISHQFQLEGNYFPPHLAKPTRDAAVDDVKLDK